MIEILVNLVNNLYLTVHMLNRLLTFNMVRLEFEIWYILVSLALIKSLKTCISLQILTSSYMVPFFYMIWGDKLRCFD